MRILVFGDSISEGFWDYKKGGWVNRLRLDFWKKYGYENAVFNFGISGHTTTHLLNNFSAFFDAICARQENKQEEAIIIFMIGINDAAKDMNTGKFQVSPEKFQKNLEEISEKIQQEKLIKEVIFISNINVWEKKANKVADEFYNYNHDIEIYNGIIEHFCEIQGYKYLDIYGKMSKSDMQIDGTHPSPAGHKKIYKLIKKYLEKNILSSKKNYEGE